MDSDAVLLERYAARRDADAFTEIVRRYAGMVYATCMRVTGNAHDAEDVAQECFLTLARRAGAISSSLPAWLHVVATNRSKDVVRGETRRRLREEAAMAEQEQADNEPTWEEIAPHVDEVLAGLPEGQRAPLVLHYLHGRTQTDVAAELGVSRATVSRRIDGGMEQLRAGLEKMGVVPSIGVLAVMLAQHSSVAPPAALMVGLAKMAIAGVGAAPAATATGATAAAAAGTSSAAGGMAILKAGIATAVVAGAVAVGVAVKDAPEPVPPPAPAVVVAAPEAPAEPTAHIMSDVDIARDIGRAIRTFVRLEAKLEGAVQDGDEVHVPGWTDADDLTLADAIADFTAGFAYHEMTRRGEMADAFGPGGIEGALRSADADVQVGAGVITAVFWQWGGQPRPETKAIANAVLDMTRSEDPCVRAAGVFCLLINSSVRGSVRPERVREIVLAALEDPAPAVRFGLVLGMADNGPMMERFPQYSGLAKDEAAAVRLLARFLPLTEGEPGGPINELLADALAEPNPIARPVGLAFYSLLLMDLGWDVDALALVEAAEDPWLRLIMGAMTAYLQRDPEGAIASAVDLLASDKRSHQAVGTLALLMASEFAAPSFRQGSPDLALAQMAESDWLWSRMVGIMLSGRAGGPEGDAQLATALRSARRTDRLAALFGCVIAFPHVATARLRPELLACWRRPSFAEQLVAAMVLCQALPWDEALGLMREEIARDPGSQSVLTLVMGLSESRWFHTGSQEEQVAGLTELVDVIVSAENAELEARIVRTMRSRLQYRTVDRMPPLERLVARGQLPTLHVLIEDRYLGWQLRSAPVLPVVLERLCASLDGGDRAERYAAADVLADLLASGSGSGTLESDRDLAADLAGRMLDACFADEGGDVASGLRLLSSLWGEQYHPFSYRNQASPAMLKAGVRALDYVNDTKHGETAARVLGGMYRWSIDQADPGVSDAMEEARRKVMEGGSPTEQIAMLRNMVLGPGGQGRGPAMAELERRVMEGAVPDGLLDDALDAMGRRGQMASERFVRFAAARYAAGKDDHVIQTGLQRVLTGASAQARRTAEDRNQPPPAWVDDVARIALKAMDDPARGDRNGALQLYAYAAGNGARGRLEQIVRDKDADLRLRGTAADMLRQVVAPDTTIYRQMLKQYDAMPSQLRYQLARAAAWSKDAPEAEAFVIRALKDTGIEQGQRGDICHTIRLPESPALRAAVEELMNDDRMHPYTRSLTRRWDREAGRDPDGATGGAPPAPRPAGGMSLRAYGAEIAKLKDAAWKKQDTVQRHVTWYGLKPHGLAFSDANRRTVTHPAGVLGHEELVVKGVAFGPRKVWLATDKGLIAWDRELKFWTLVGTGVGVLDAPVEKVEMKDGRLRVTIHPEGQEASTWECNPAEMDWRRAE